MQRYIEHLREPRELLLAWQDPESSDRFRWAVAIMRSEPNGASLRYLGPGEEFQRLNHDRTHQALVKTGFAGYPAFSPKVRTHQAGVLEAFLRRLPPRKRSDFVEFIRHFRLPPGRSVSDFALLGLTEAKLPSDGFSLVDPLDPDLGNCDLVMEAVGHHYRASASSFDLREGEQGTILWERDNPYDSSAVAFCFQGRIAGYVNRLQAPVFCQWLNSRQIDVQVDRVNGRLGRPRLFVFVQVRPRLLCAA